MASANIKFVHLDEDGVTVDRNPMTGLIRSMNRWGAEVAATGVVLTELARQAADRGLDERDDES